MFNFFHHIQREFVRAFREDKTLLRWEKRHPQSYHWVRRRLAFNEPHGFMFTLGCAATLALLGLFYLFTVGVLFNAPFVAADAHIMDLVAALRTETTANFFLVFTDFFDPAVVVSFVITAVLMLWVLNRRREIKFFVLGAVIAELVFLAISAIVARARPELSYALITQSGYSFPSMHAAMSLFFYGMIGYGFLEVFTRWWQRSLTALFVFGLTFLTGFSRLYLGVHWSSDVIAGWILGFAFLIYWVTLFEEWERFHPVREPMRVTFKSAVFIGLILLIIESAFIGWYYTTHPLDMPENVDAYLEVEMPHY